LFGREKKRDTVLWYADILKVGYLENLNFFFGTVVADTVVAKVMVMWF